MAPNLFSISLSGATAGSGVSNNCKNSQFKCSNPLRLTCIGHGEEISVRCGRWRTCNGCRRWTEWRLKERFLAGIQDEGIPQGKLAIAFTLTFPLSRAPDEDGAHKAWRALVARLRYRGYLGAFGWVLQRQKNGTLHYHGIAQMPWLDLAEWRELLTKSGFGPRNRVEVAQPDHARYIASYISKRLADLAPLRRAYAFSPGFPQASAVVERKALADLYGVELDSDCEWTPSYELYF